MTDLALRRQVAEAKGWKDIRVVDGELWGSYSRMSTILSEWDTDIAAAWPLLEEMIAAGVDDAILLAVLKDPDTPAATCQAWLKYKEQQNVQQ